MKLKEIKLLTNDIEAVNTFYHKWLGAPLIFKSIDSVTVQIGQSRLTFTQNNASFTPYYHFAINITQSKVQKAVQWLQERNILINPVDGHDVVHSQSWNSDSVYFYDLNGNIVEFIARHNLPIPDATSDHFDSKDFFAISEIGLPSRDVSALAQFIQEQFNEQVYISGNSLFYPIGDEEGLFILSSTERNWLGSDKKVEIFPLEIILDSHNKETSQLLDYPYMVKTEEIRHIAFGFQDV